MLPDRIRAFAAGLITRTEGNEFVWVYDDVHATVVLRTDTFGLTLRYSFSESDTCGEFVLIYRDQDGREYRFYTNQDHDDYKIARRLYEVAQSSGMKLPF
jgi:hypothetical protein